jgi:hypothetical protein
MVIHVLFGAVAIGVGLAIVGTYWAGPTWLRGVMFVAGLWLFAGHVLGLIARLPSNCIDKLS